MPDTVRLRHEMAETANRWSEGARNLSLIAQVMMVSVPWHPFLNLPLYFFGVRWRTISPPLVLLTTGLVTLWSAHAQVPLDSELAIWWVYLLAYAYCASVLLFPGVIPGLSAERLTGTLLVMAGVVLVAWLAWPSQLAQLFRQEVPQRFAGWTREPSFFSDIAFVILLSGMLSRRYLLQVAAWVFIFVCLLTGQSATLLLYLAIGGLCTLTVMATTALQMPLSIATGALLSGAIALNALMVGVSQLKGSWRAISNVAALQSATAKPNTPQGGSDAFLALMGEYGFGYMESVYSLFFFLLRQAGWIIGGLLVVLVALTLWHILRTLRDHRVPMFTSGFLIAGYLIAWFFSAKWLIIAAIPAIHVLAFLHETPEKVGSHSSGPTRSHSSA